MPWIIVNGVCITKAHEPWRFEDALARVFCWPRLYRRGEDNRQESFTTWLSRLYWIVPLIVMFGHENSTNSRLCGICNTFVVRTHAWWWARIHRKANSLHIIVIMMTIIITIERMAYAMIRNLIWWSYSVPYEGPSQRIASHCLFRFVWAAARSVRNLRSTNVCNGNNNNWQWMACCMHIIVWNSSFAVYPARWHVLSVLTAHIATLSFIHLRFTFMAYVSRRRSVCVCVGWNASAHYLYEDNHEWQLCQLYIRALNLPRMRALILHINKIYSLFSRNDFMASRTPECHT